MAVCAVLGLSSERDCPVSTVYIPVLTDPTVHCIACGKPIHVGQIVVYCRSATLTEDGKLCDNTQAEIEACGTCGTDCLRLLARMLEVE